MPAGRRRRRAQRRRLYPAGFTPPGHAEPRLREPGSLLSTAPGGPGAAAAGGREGRWEAAGKGRDSGRRAPLSAAGSECAARPRGPGCQRRPGSPGPQVG